MTSTKRAQPVGAIGVSVMGLLEVDLAGQQVVLVTSAGTQVSLLVNEGDNVPGVLGLGVVGLRTVIVRGTGGAIATRTLGVSVAGHSIVGVVVANEDVTTSLRALTMEGLLLTRGAHGNGNVVARVSRSILGGSVVTTLTGVGAVLVQGQVEILRVGVNGAAVEATILGESDPYLHLIRHRVVSGGALSVLRGGASHAPTTLVTQRVGIAALATQRDYLHVTSSSGLSVLVKLDALRTYDNVASGVVLRAQDRLGHDAVRSGQGVEKGGGHSIGGPGVVLAHLIMDQSIGTV